MSDPSVEAGNFSKMTIPAAVEDLEPRWFSEVLGLPVTAVDVLDAHSGTTGRARVGLSGSSELPVSVFVKLQPFSPEQRSFLRKVGLGIAEARLYDAVGDDLPVRIPRVWHVAVRSRGRLVRDGARGPRRLRMPFPTPGDDDMLDVATSLMDELALLHAGYRGRDLPWLTPPTACGASHPTVNSPPAAHTSSNSGSISSVMRWDRRSVHSPRRTSPARATSSRCSARANTR